MLVAQDEERRRIARELHDGTAATLVALSLDLARLVDVLPEGKERELAASCVSLCAQSLRDLRTVAFILHPPLIEREGLAVALRWLADGFEKRSGIHVRLELRPFVRHRLRPHVEVALYRIAQEALTNVLRHSGSPTARVALAVTEAKAQLTISDDGTRAAGIRSGGVGIASMRERARALGGRLRLRARRRGTVVTVAVPIPAGRGGSP